MTWTDRDSQHEIKELLPASVLVRRSALFQVGLMDESWNMGRTGRGIERVVYAGDSRADGALVNPYGHEEIVATIRRILEDDALDQWLRVNDVRRAALFSCTRSAPQTASVYGQAYHEGQA